MKRILVVDDERPVVDGILHIVKRDLADEFEIVGTASTGREAIDRASTLGPDIILLDVRMPGLSGLDAVRELRRRGSEAVFILVTAYERFDIALEAVELGVLDYLLKPVTREMLARSLRAAAAFVDRRGELEHREIEHKEREERLHAFVETAFLHAIVLGEKIGPQLEKYRKALALEEEVFLAVAIAFRSTEGSTQVEEAAAMHERIRETLRYKSRALVGPLFRKMCIVIIPLKEEAEALAAEAELREILSQALETKVGRGPLRLGFGRVADGDELHEAWNEALLDLWGEGARSEIQRGSPRGHKGGIDAVDKDHEDYADHEAYSAAIVEGSAESAREALERIVLSLRYRTGLTMAERFRLASLFGGAYRSLEKRKALGTDQANEEFDMRDLLEVADGPDMELALRARHERVAEWLRLMPRHSVAVAGAIAFVRDNFGGSITLELAADAVGLSPNRLSRLFVEETGKGFSDYLIQFRIERAKAMLLLPEASIKQVSVACGYPDPNYFSRLFKKVTGLTPTAFSSGTMEAKNEAQ